MSEESLLNGVVLLAVQALSQESSNRKRRRCTNAERFVPFIQTYPDLLSDLGHKPGWNCELILVLRKGLATVGVTWYAWLATGVRRDQRWDRPAMGRARPRAGCQPVIKVSACSLLGWWLQLL